MDNWMVLIIIIMVLIVFGLVGFVIYLFSTKKEEDDDRTIGISFFPQRHGFQAIGEEIDIKNAPHGRRITTLSPSKFVPIKAVLKGASIMPFNVITDRDKIISLPKGRHDKHRHINFYLPARASEFSSEWKNSEFGKWMMFFVETKNVDNNVLKALQKAMESQAFHVREHAGGEATILQMKKLQEFFTDALDTTLQAKKDKQGQGLSTLGQNIGG